MIRVDGFRVQLFFSASFLLFFWILRSEFPLSLFGLLIFCVVLQLPFFIFPFSFARNGYAARVFQSRSVDIDLYRCDSSRSKKVKSFFDLFLFCFIGIVTVFFGLVSSPISDWLQKSMWKILLKIDV